MVQRLIPAVAALSALLAIGTAVAFGAAVVRIPTRPVAGNPADRLSRLAMDPVRYDGATHCTGKVSKGVKALVAWLESTRARGEDWGSYRCEKWGSHSASLHAEGRAEDWHLDVHDPADRKEAEKLIQLLLAPDRGGHPAALATRMGVEELIWDCHYWSAGSDAFRPYSVCFTADGRRRRNVDETAAHMNHIHLGLTKAAAVLETTFWRHQPSR